MNASGQRPLDTEEQRLLDAVCAGATEVISSGAASLEVRWEESDGEGTAPEFALTPRALGAPAIGFWMWPYDRGRRDGVIVGLWIGDSDAGISARFGGLDWDDLAGDVAARTRAFVEGRASYVARPVEAEAYDPEPPAGALSVVIRCHSAKRDWASSTAGYLEDPVRFRDITGIVIVEALGVEHAFAPYVSS